MIKNQKITFLLPDNITIVDIIDKILKNNGLEESLTDFIDKVTQKKEPRKMIIRDAALTITEKKFPEEKLVELLQTHLETSKEVAENIIKEIKEKLIPYAKEISMDEEKITETPLTLSTQEIILEKIRVNNPNQQAEPSTQPAPLEIVKEVEIKNVEENAKKIENVGKGKQDTYREPIE